MLLGDDHRRGTHRRYRHEPTPARGQHVRPSLKKPPRFEGKLSHGDPLLGGVLADAQRLPHERCQVGDRHSNSTRPGTTSEWWFEPLRQAGPDLPSSNPFFIYVGNVKPHKNLHRLVEAIAGMPEGVDLYVVGGNAVAKNFDVVALKAIEHSNGVLLLGRVEREELKCHLSKAFALVMPSLYEGLGLPPLEAMAVGTPVAAASIPALRETCAQAAAYFDPRDVDDIRRVLNDLRLSQHCGTISADSVELVLAPGRRGMPPRRSWQVSSCGNHGHSDGCAEDSISPALRGVLWPQRASLGLGGVGQLGLSDLSVGDREQLQRERVFR
jgi:hypothetical protein